LVLPTEHSADELDGHLGDFAGDFPAAARLLRGDDLLPDEPVQRVPRSGPIDRPR
jgi:hypothetical protein